MMKMWPYLEIIEVVSVRCNIANNDDQQDSRVFLSRLYWSIIRDFTQKPYLLQTFTSEVLYIEVWFTDQTSKQLEIEVK